MPRSAYYPRVSPAYPVRRRWPMFIPFAVVVVLAVAWSGFWFYAAARAETEVASWRARELASGRRQECESQSIAGFPFRIELRCGGAELEAAGKPTLHFKLPSLLAAVQVYDPKLMIGEFTGPLEIAEPGRAAAQVVDWKLGQASVRRGSSEVERGSLVLQAVSVRDAGADDTIFKAGRVELHGRRVPGSAPDNYAVEFVLRLQDANAERLHPIAAKPIDAEMVMVLSGLSDVTPKPWVLRFREWQARDGKLEITNARIAQGDLLAVGSGVLRLTPNGNLDGNLQLTVAGVERLLKMFDIERIMSEGQIGATINALDKLMPGFGGIARQNAAPGLMAALGQRTMLEGRQAVTFPMRFSDGAVFLGPFQVGVAPRLF
jgi:hypothetical protein